MDWNYIIYGLFGISAIMYGYHFFRIISKGIIGVENEQESIKSNKNWLNIASIVFLVGILMFVVKAFLEK